MTLRERRTARGMTQAELAAAAGICKTQIQKIEAGQIQLGNVTLTNAARIAAALEITIEELLQ